MLVDIVSKNGNLLINVVQRPDGSLDREAEQVLDGMAAWIAINGEGLYETRPWLVHGEGPVRAKGGHFGEDFAYSAKDLRFTMKGEKTLYAFAMGWPTDGKIVIRSLARFPEATGKITDVALLGHAGKVTWTHTADGLAVDLPAEKPCDYAVALKITGEDLRGFKPELAAPQVPAIKPDAAGNYTLGAEDAELHGDGIKTEAQGGQPNIGFWDKPLDWVSWKVSFKEAGRFKVTVACAAANKESALALEIADQKAEVKVPTTGAWDKFTELEMGAIEVKKAGDQVVKVRPRDPQSWSPVNLRWVKLTRSP
jgi:alpha-L-fucosidase